MPQAKGTKDILCGVCRKACKGRKGLHIHMSMKGSCRRVMQARANKKRPRVRTDAMAPPETTEDDPPMDWDVHMSDGESVSATEFRKSQHHPEEHHGAEDAPPSVAHPGHQAAESDDNIFTEKFPFATGSSMGTAPTIFQELRARQAKGEIGDFGPFRDQDEWELVEWLLQCGASQTEIDKYLHLNIVRSKDPPVSLWCV